MSEAGEEREAKRKGRAGERSKIEAQEECWLTLTLTELVEN